jgi:predicted ferric reductase
VSAWHVYTLWIYSSFLLRSRPHPVDIWHRGLRKHLVLHTYALFVEAELGVLHPFDKARLFLELATRD